MARLKQTSEAEEGIEPQEAVQVSDQIIDALKELRIGKALDLHNFLARHGPPRDEAVLKLLSKFCQTAETVQLQGIPFLPPPRQFPFLTLFYCKVLVEDHAARVKGWGGLGPTVDSHLDVFQRCAEKIEAMSAAPGKRIHDLELDSTAWWHDGMENFNFDDLFGQWYFYTNTSNLTNILNFTNTFNFTHAPKLTNTLNFTNNNLNTYNSTNQSSNMQYPRKMIFAVLALVLATAVALPTPLEGGDGAIEVPANMTSELEPREWDPKKQEWKNEHKYRIFFQHFEDDECEKLLHEDKLHNPHCKT
ncbi:hypothetical protein KC343_g3753, partial [Hortaea werneckii]